MASLESGSGATAAAAERKRAMAARFASLREVMTEPDSPGGSVAETGGGPPEPGPLQHRLQNLPLAGSAVVPSSRTVLGGSRTSFADKLMAVSAQNGGVVRGPVPAPELEPEPEPELRLIPVQLDGPTYGASTSVYKEVTGFDKSESFLKWGPQEVAKWLRTEVLQPSSSSEQVIQQLVDRGITGAQLSDSGLNQERLKNDIHIRSGLVRKKILMAVAKVTIEAPTVTRSEESGVSDRKPPSRRALQPSLSESPSKLASPMATAGAVTRPSPRDVTLVVPAAAGLPPRWRSREPGVVDDRPVKTEVWNPKWTAKLRADQKAEGVWEEVEDVEENHWGKAEIGPTLATALTATVDEAAPYIMSATAATAETRVGSILLASQRLTLKEGVDTAAAVPRPMLAEATQSEDPHSSLKPLLSAKEILDARADSRNWSAIRELSTGPVLYINAVTHERTLHAPAAVRDIGIEELLNRHGMDRELGDSMEPSREPEELKRRIEEMLSVDSIVTPIAAFQGLQPDPDPVSSFRPLLLDQSLVTKHRPPNIFSHTEYVRHMFLCACAERCRCYILRLRSCVRPRVRCLHKSVLSSLESAMACAGRVRPADPTMHTLHCLEHPRLLQMELPDDTGQLLCRVQARVRGNMARRGARLVPTERSAIASVLSRPNPTIHYLREEVVARLQTPLIRCAEQGPEDPVASLQSWLKDEQH